MIEASLDKDDGELVSELQLQITNQIIKIKSII